MKQWPLYYKDFLTVSNPKCNVGVCTLWTPKDKLTNQLDKKSFSLAGQLYSKRGINFILRNVLANPYINRIVLCGADRSESGEALIKFVKKGIDKKYRVIGDKKCEIQRELNKEAIEDFRKNVEVIDMRGEVDTKKISKVIRGKVAGRNLKPWAKPRKFKETEFHAADKFPSEKTAFNIRAGFVWEAWIQILRLIMKFGSKKGMIKIGEVKELVNVITVIEKEDPYDPELPGIFNFGKRDLKLYYKDFFDSSKGTESYNYGERMFAYPAGVPVGDFNSSKNQRTANTSTPLGIDSKLTKVVGGLDQLEEIYEKYKRYHEDRGLVVAIWNPWIDNVKEGWMAEEGGKGKAERAGNVPCMALLQFTYRSKKMHLTAYFRSNDMFDAWPRNAFALRKLQYDFAKRVGKSAGYLTTISNCGQIYENNYEKAIEIIEKFKDRTFCMGDPRGTVIIEVKGNEIIVRHMSPDGNTQLGEYKINGRAEKASLKLMDELIINDVFSKDYHIADIATELSKAEWCVKNGVNFIQDRDCSELI
ncbi:hypothetical protein JW766_00995 [Candidatus Dojkabacteria bacterium]|nr:hypothetical protein [Candidatus Dojkabacteria bacterium]